MRQVVIQRKNTSKVKHKDLLIYFSGICQSCFQLKIKSDLFFSIYSYSSVLKCLVCWFFFFRLVRYRMRYNIAIYKNCSF